MIAGRGEGATTTRESVDAGCEGSYTGDIDNPDVAPALSEWVAACFPQSCPASERDLRDLVREAADSARNDYDASSAMAWGTGINSPRSLSQMMRHAWMKPVGILKRW